MVLLTINVIADTEEKSSAGLFMMAMIKMIKKRSQWWNLAPTVVNRGIFEVVSF
jgi:hypothetical protein